MAQEVSFTELTRIVGVFRERDDLKHWHDTAWNLYKMDKAAGLPYVREFRTEMTRRAQKGDATAYNFCYKSYLITAQDSFDDFMIACEWRRQPNAQFWLPRRGVWEGKHGVATKIQRFLDDDNAKLLCLSCPPGTGKTTLIKFLLAYIAGKYPQSANMYCSYADGMVKIVYDSLVAIMTDVTEYSYNEIFPGLGAPTTSAEYATLSYRKKGDFPTLGLVSIGGSVTGRTRANRFMITDDLVKNDEMAKSPGRLEKLWADYNNTLTTRQIGDNVKSVILGTIWSLYDPISRQKAKHEGKPGYEFIALPVCDEDGHSNFNFVHPDRYTDEKIKEIKENLDPVTFSCVYMQQGVEKEGLAFSADRLRFYNGVLPDGEPDNILFYADVAWGGGDSFSMPIAYVYGDDVYIHDVLFDQRDKSVTKPRVIGKILQHKIKMGRLEANNGGAEYADDIARMLREKHSYSMNIGSKKAAGNTAKLVRIEQHQDAIRRYYFLSESARDVEYRKFMNELTSFSFTSKNLHDDSADSLAGLADYMNRGPNTAIVQRRPF